MKFAGYKINTQKLLAFLYTNNERSEREIKETILFIITSKRIKYLGINLPKEAKNLYSKNYKMLMTEIKDDTERERERYHVLAFSSVDQSCPTLCDPKNHSTPGFPVHRDGNTRLHDLPLAKPVCRSGSNS